MSKILENLQRIESELYNANVRVIAVSKYVGVNEIIEAYNAGIKNFAENKAQDAEKKCLQLPEEVENEIIWHYVGHLQTNKVNKIVGKFQYIHSVDSFKLASIISEYATQKNIIQKVLIQVNIAQEISKFGFDILEVEEVFNKILSLSSLDIVGLMTMAPFTDDEDEIRSTFRGLRELRNRLEEKYSCTLNELSMGMSNDYKIAVQEGATMIRLGQIIFN